MVAAAFEEKFEVELDEEERERAFREVVIKVRKAGLAEELKSLDGKDMKKFIEITKKQNELRRLEF